MYFNKEKTFNNMKKQIYNKEMIFIKISDLDFQIQIQLFQINSQ